MVKELIGLVGLGRLGTPMVAIRGFAAALFVTLAPAVSLGDPPGPISRRLEVTHSWFANSHSDASFMPQGIEGMIVTPDGTTYTNIR